MRLYSYEAVIQQSNIDIINYLAIKAIFKYQIST